MPSRFGSDGVGEGLPVALMEAMAYGKAVVATRHTGIPELVPEMLVAEDDVDGLAKTLSRLADDPALRREQGSRNRKIVEYGYSDRNVLELLETLQSRTKSVATS